MADGAPLEDASRIFSAYTNPAETKSTVIVGAGIIGCATAYYLSRTGNTKPDTIHLVEASPELFASASGRAAGFLASDCKIEQ
jgi:glycine/D-amino acid oxidase-like deaminating enzyme